VESFFFAEVLEKTNRTRGVTGGADEGSEVDERLIEDESFAAWNQGFC